MKPGSTPAADETFSAWRKARAEQQARLNKLSGHYTARPRIRHREAGGVARPNRLELSSTHTQPSQSTSIVRAQPQSTPPACSINTFSMNFGRIPAISSLPGSTSDRQPITQPQTSSISSRKDMMPTPPTWSNPRAASAPHSARAAMSSSRRTELSKVRERSEPRTSVLSQMGGQQRAVLQERRKL